MIAVRCQAITTMNGATGKSAHFAMDNFSAAIVNWQSQRNNSIKR